MTFEEENNISIEKKGDSSGVEEKKCSLRGEDAEACHHSTMIEYSCLQPKDLATPMLIANYLERKKRTYGILNGFGKNFPILL